MNTFPCLHLSVAYFRQVLTANKRKISDIYTDKILYQDEQTEAHGPHRSSEKQVPAINKLQHNYLNIQTHFQTGLPLNFNIEFAA